MKNRRIGGEDLSQRVRAIALLSGGLDSVLAATIVKRAGIDVVGLSLRLFGNDEAKTQRVILESSRKLNVPVRVVDLSNKQLEVVKHPKHGYGAGVNPCIDCRILMLEEALHVMKEEKAQFVVTGEVVGQRPMSQHRHMLDTIQIESGLGDRLLRPLSANLLADTLPVKQGWLSKTELYSISGRGRQEQIRLAQKFGITSYSQSAGGCILTDKVYAARVRDSFLHVGKEVMGMDEFTILRYGRHFRISDRAKLIVGRNEEENNTLLGFTECRYKIEPIDIMGPLGLLEGRPTKDDLLLAARIVARYCDHEGALPVALSVYYQQGLRTLQVAPLADEDSRLDVWRIEA
jgi:tRNA U34 2-thiouridine synthase MnmA/TrmU